MSAPEATFTECPDQPCDHCDTVARLHSCDCHCLHNGDPERGLPVHGCESLVDEWEHPEWIEPDGPGQLDTRAVCGPCRTAEDDGDDLAAYRVLVTGSRDWTDRAAITGLLNELKRQHGNRLVIVHGACPTGADAIAARWARVSHTAQEAHAANWRVHGRAAGPRRNAAMVATDPDACLAFIRNNSRGTAGCARLAEKAGIPTLRTESEVAA